MFYPTFSDRLIPYTLVVLSNRYFEKVENRNSRNVIPKRRNEARKNDTLDQPSISGCAAANNFSS